MQKKGPMWKNSAVNPTEDKIGQKIGQKMIVLNPHISFISSSIKRVNTPLKNKIMLQWIKYKYPTIPYFQEINT